MGITNKRYCQAIRLSILVTGIHALCAYISALTGNAILHYDHPSYDGTAQDIERSVTIGNVSLSLLALVTSPWWLDTQTHMTDPYVIAIFYCADLVLSGCLGHFISSADNTSYTQVAAATAVGSAVTAIPVGILSVHCFFRWMFAGTRNHLQQRLLTPPPYSIEYDFPQQTSRTVNNAAAKTIK